MKSFKVPAGYQVRPSKDGEVETPKKQDLFDKSELAPRSPSKLAEETFGKPLDVKYSTNDVIQSAMVALQESLQGNNKHKINRTFIELHEKLINLPSSGGTAVTVMTDEGIKAYLNAACAGTVKKKEMPKGTAQERITEAQVENDLAIVPEGLL